MYPGREPDLNDPYQPTVEHWVDREKIFKAWEEIHRRHNKSLPPFHSMEIVDIAGDYRKRAEKYTKERSPIKARAYVYFACLLLLKRSFLIEDRDLIEANRALLRALEKYGKYEELIPR